MESLAVDAPAVDALAVEALAVAWEPSAGPVYEPLIELPPTDGRRAMESFFSASLRLPVRDLAVLAEGRPGVAELARQALSGLPAPSAPQAFVLVQQSHDHEHLSMPLPRLVEEMPWEVSEDLGLSHGQEHGGLAALDLLRWVLEPGGHAVLVLSDRPEVCVRDALPSGAVVALRLVRGEGPLNVVGQGWGTPPTDASRVLDAVGPCGGWVALHRSLGERAAAPGELILLREAAPAAPGGHPPGWLMLRANANADVNADVNVRTPAGGTA